MTSNDSEPPLGENAATKIGRIVASAPGGIPFVGPIIQSAILEVIPNIRLQRIENYLRHLQSQIGGLQLESALRSNVGLDLFEEGIWQSARALTDERKSYIANLVCGGLSGADTKVHKVRHYLRLLNQLDDRQIILLAKYHPKYRPTIGSEAATEFFEKNKDIVNPGHMRRGFFDKEGGDDVDEAIRLNTSMLGQLASLGFLFAKAVWDDTGMPKNDKHYNITPLGAEFLDFIGAI